MPKKRVFMSCRIQEMRHFREAAIRAIEDAGMEPLFFDSTDPLKRWPLKPGVPIIDQLLDGVRTADAFLGLYGETLDTNWTPDGHDKHSMELEFETAVAARLPCFLYTPPNAERVHFDGDMTRFRRVVMQRAVEFLSTPEALYEDLRAKLSGLRARLFISYSSKDQHFVDELMARLRESGELAWLNTESIPKGNNWHEEMVKGLSETDVLLLVVSANSMASKWVKEEWKFFLKAGKRVLPMLLEDGSVQVPAALSKIEMIKTERDDWYHRLLKALAQ